MYTQTTIITVIISIIIIITYYHAVEAPLSLLLRLLALSSLSLLYLKHYTRIYAKNRLYVSCTCLPVFLPISNHWVWTNFRENYYQHYTKSIFVPLSSLPILKRKHFGRANLLDGSDNSTIWCTVQLFCVVTDIQKIYNSCWEHFL
jgi:hypothetical protein